MKESHAGFFFFEQVMYITANRVGYYAWIIRIRF